ncbi:MAG: hypothetical protein WA322_23140 [Pseudolabrys sp.]
MLSTVARGTYVLVLTAMIVAWAVSLGKEVPAEAQPTCRVALHMSVFGGKADIAIRGHHFRFWKLADGLRASFVPLTWRFVQRGYR